MPLVRMIITMSGTRADNRPWPPYLGEIEVDDWEAEDLVNGRHAEYVDKPILERGWDVLRVPDPNFETRLKRPHEEESNTPEPVYPADYEDEDLDDDFDRRDEDFDRDEEVTPEVKKMKRPATTDAKAEWVKWAVQNGAEEKHALEFTKAQLVAKYSKL